MLMCNVFATEYEEEEDSEEESGKDWDELEKEAVKGTLQYYILFITLVCSPSQAVQHSNSRGLAY